MAWGAVVLCRNGYDMSKNAMVYKLLCIIMRPYQNQERGTSASKKNDHSPNLPKMFFFKYMHPKPPKCLLAPELHVNNALSPQTPKTPGGIPVICSSYRSFQLYKLYLFFLSLQTAYSRQKKIKEINYCCVLIVSIKQTRGRPPWSSG